MTWLSYPTVLFGLPKNESVPTETEMIVFTAEETSSDDSSSCCFCPICLEKPEGDVAHAACCDALFCDECITTWVTRSGNTCPVCRGTAFVGGAYVVVDPPTPHGQEHVKKAAAIFACVAGVAVGVWQVVVQLT